MSDQKDTAADKAATKPADQPAEKVTKKVKARVLVDSVAGTVDSVVSADPAQIKAWKEQGFVDADPAAVAYAEKVARAAARTDDADAPLE